MSELQSDWADSVGLDAVALWFIRILFSHAIPIVYNQQTQRFFLLWIYHAVNQRGLV